MGWASRPSKKDGRDAHPTITIKIVSYLIRDPKIFKLVKSEELRLHVFQEAVLEKARNRYKFWEGPQKKASGFLCFWDYFY